MRAAAISLLAAFLVLAVQSAFSHPEDEFCVPGEGGLDPALCQALSAMDRPGEVVSDQPVKLERSVLATVGQYVLIGLRHILPGGLDHILFVLAFFLSTRRLRALIFQIGAFTVAHTITLGLTAANVMSPPPSLVEPAIAFSIAWVAIQNVLGREAGRTRVGVVFAFGLIHGMGFAGFVSGVGLPADAFFPALCGFNLGVEFGQLAVIALALLVTWWWHPMSEEGPQPQYAKWVVRPASFLIAAVALFWTVERLLG
ncbi:MAG: HupE/UreJ family protein [Pseudomonadota bacterium]